MNLLVYDNLSYVQFPRFFKVGYSRLVQFYVLLLVHLKGKCRLCLHAQESCLSP